MFTTQRRLPLVGLLSVLAVAACVKEAPTAPDLLAEAQYAKGAPGVPGGGSGGGGGDEGFGNNLSWPVIFADGRGLGGAVITGPTDFGNTGLRPLATETAAAAARATAGAGPFWYSGNTSELYNTLPYFFQKTANVWQAEWITGTGVGSTGVIVDWGDNLRSVKFATTSVVRVEHVLNASTATPLQGYTMDLVVNPSSPTELQGILDDGNQTQTSLFTPTVFTDRARLTLQKLSAKGGAVTYTYLDTAVYQSFGTDGPGGYAAEINVGGKVLYGYVWNLKNVVMPPGVPKDGWWRITYSLDSGSGVTITGVGVGDEALATSSANSTSAEILIGTNRGGGGKKP